MNLVLRTSSEDTTLFGITYSTVKPPEDTATMLISIGNGNIKEPESQLLYHDLSTRIESTVQTCLKGHKESSISAVNFLETCLDPSQLGAQIPVDLIS